MAKKDSNDIMSNSLKGRIWLAVGALAVLNCIFTLLTYLAASFFTSNTFFLVLPAFIVTTMFTVIFGRWMVNEILSPIKQVALLAKSLERSASVSLPKTTGSSETDELLDIIHRNGRQLQNLIGMMDDVSSGNTKTALTPLENSDRLSSSFQKLVSKVTDSVDAAAKLSELQTAVAQLISDLSTLKNGNLNFEARGGHAATKAIAESVRTLIAKHVELAAHVNVNVAEADRAVQEARKLVRIAIENGDAMTRKFVRVSDALQQGQNHFEQISLEAASALSGIDRTAGDFETAKQIARDSTEAVNDLKEHINSASRKLQSIIDQSQAITRISKLAEDMARRSKLIALNTSIQAASSKGTGVALIADEIASLSDRAGRVNKEVSVINETIVREIDEAQSALQKLVNGITAISGHSAKSNDVMARLDTFFDNIMHLPAKIEAGKNERLSGKQQLLSILGEYNSDASSAEINLKDCEQAISKFAEPLANLRGSVTARSSTGSKQAENAPNNYTAANDFRTLGKNAEPMELQGEN